MIPRNIHMHLIMCNVLLENLQEDKNYIYTYINIQQLASNQDFSFFGANGNIFLNSHEKSRKLKCAKAGTQTTDLLLSGQAS